MTFSEKLTGLRRKSGMSQEQLADRLGVTRQSVSKWEGGTAMPELVKLISLSELFGVSVDYLVKDWMEEPDNPCGGSGEISSKQADRLEKKVDELTNYVKGRVYRYDSKTRIFGLPLVSIRFGFVRNGKLSMDNTAKGIIAIGNCAIGVVAIGIVGVGLFTFGVLAMGMLSLGIVAGGLAAFGVAALGYLALGVSAVGVYAGGVAAIAAKIAVAVSAVAPTAVGEFASGSHVLLWGDGLTAADGDRRPYQVNRCPVSCRRANMVNVCSPAYGSSRHQWRGTICAPVKSAGGPAVGHPGTFPGSPAGYMQRPRPRPHPGALKAWSPKALQWPGGSAAAGPCPGDRTGKGHRD